MPQTRRISTWLRYSTRPARSAINTAGIPEKYVPGAEGHIGNESQTLLSHGVCDFFTKSCRAVRNTNGLSRQYPKGTDLVDLSHATLNEVARQLNSRPRKTLNYESPAERFNQSVASTG